MFSEVCVTSTPGGRWATLKVTTPPPGTRSQHLPPSPWDQVTTLPSLSPGTRSQHLPSYPLGPGHNTSLPTPGTRSQHLPPSPLGPDHNTSLPLGTRSQHLPPDNTSLPLDQVTTPSSPRDYAQAGGTHPNGMHSCSEYAVIHEDKYENRKSFRPSVSHHRKLSQKCRWSKPKVLFLSLNRGFTHSLFVKTLVYDGG